MKIALGQFHIYWEDKTENLKKLDACLRRLDGTGTELLLLPEMSLTGFSMNTEKTKEKEKETVRKIQKLAGEHGLAVGIGWVKDQGNTCENHYSIVTEEGELLDYAKIHPFSFGEESHHFTGGRKLAFCRYKGFSISVQICYDLRFPEPFQILSKETDLIVVPANWPAARREHWDTLLRARAIENQVYIAGVNCAGDIGGQYYSGDSVVYRPDGSELKAEQLIDTEEKTCPEEKIFLMEIKPDVAKYRETFPAKKDRREQLYKKLGST